MKNLLLTSLCLVSTLTFGCASTLSVRSEPAGADVSIREMGSTEEQVIGQTPLTISSSDLKLTGKTKPFVVKVHHRGAGEKSALITRIDGQDIDLFLTLDGGLTAPSTAQLNTVIDDLFRAQSLAKAKDIDGAMKLLSKLIDSNPRIAAAYELRGSLYIVKNELSAALRDYDVAVQLNPNSLEAGRVQKQLQDLMKRGADRSVSSERTHR